MERFLGAYSSYIYAVMRIVVGFLFACHGAQKLFGVLGGVNQRGASAPLLSLFGLAGIIEFVGGLLIAVGLMTGYAAFVASGEMAAALLHRTLPPRLLADPERRRAGSALLLRVPVHRQPRSGRMEHRPGTRGAVRDRAAPVG